PGAAGADPAARAPGRLVATGLRPRLLDTMAGRGVSLPAGLFQAPAGGAAAGPGMRAGSAGPGRPARPGRATGPVFVRDRPGMGRRARVPSPRELAEPERSR
ncbi:MAG: hypothetical protein ACRD0J_02710, partial [Acidimicrobiales bacterium]